MPWLDMYPFTFPISPSCDTSRNSRGNVWRLDFSKSGINLFIFSSNVPDNMNVRASLSYVPCQKNKHEVSNSF